MLSRFVLHTVQEKENADAMSMNSNNRDRWAHQDAQRDNAKIRSGSDSSNGQQRAAGTLPSASPRTTVPALLRGKKDCVNGDGHVDYYALLSTTPGGGGKTPTAGGRKREFGSIDGVQGDAETCGQKRPRDSASASGPTRKSRVFGTLEIGDGFRAVDGATPAMRRKRMLERDTEEQKQVCVQCVCVCVFLFLVSLPASRWRVVSSGDIICYR